MAAFAAYTIIGLSLGGIFSLAALGIVLIYRTTGVLNFAHGAMGMFSTFVAWQVFYGWSHPFWPGWISTLLAVIAGLVFAALMGLFLEFAVFRWVRTRPPVVKAVITIGVLLALQSTASLIWKNNQYHLPIYIAPQDATFVMADVPIGANYVVIVLASLGLAFNTGNLFPQEMAGGAFVGQHGSWNRKPRAGYKVIFVPFADGKPAGKPQDVLTGFLSDNGEAQGRPVGLRIDKHGALLVADDVGNAVWRVTPSEKSASR